MKRLIITCLGAVLLGVTASSCQKEQQKPAITTDNGFSSQQQTMNQTSSSWGLNNTLIYLMQDCIPVPYDCFDEIVITPTELDNLNDAIDAGPLAVGEFFSDSENYSGFLPSNEAGIALAGELSTGEFAIKSYAVDTKHSKLFIGKGTADSANYEWVLPLSLN